DVVADLRLEHVDAFCAAFPATDFYLSRDAMTAAIRQHHQFNVLHPGSGLKIDMIVPTGSEFDRCRLRRGRRLQAGADLEVCFASPEDVIIKKLEYFQEGGSEKHLRDITGVVKVQGDRLNRAYVTEWAARLGFLEVWQEVLQRIGNG